MATVFVIATICCILAPNRSSSSDWMDLCGLFRKYRPTAQVLHKHYPNTTGKCIQHAGIAPCPVPNWEVTRLSFPLLAALLRLHSSRVRGWLVGREDERMEGWDLYPTTVSSIARSRPLRAVTFPRNVNFHPGYTMLSSWDKLDLTSRIRLHEFRIKKKQVWVANEMSRWICRISYQSFWFWKLLIL